MTSFADGAAPGPSSTDAARAAGAVASAEAERGRVFPCEQCGADLTFHIGAQRLKCGFCGHEKSLAMDEERVVSERDLVATLERTAAQRAARRAPASGPPPASDRHELHCDACGATVAFAGTLTSTSCPYCGAPTQRRNVHDAPERLPVDGVLPFLVEAAEAKRNLAAWVKSRWFAPGDFKRYGVQGRLAGTYLPYFSFDAMTTTTYRGQRGDHYVVTVGSGNQRRREIRTRWSAAFGTFQRFFDNVLVPALASLPARLLDKLEPWPLAKCLPFTAAVLAGKLAHTYDVELAAGFTRAKERIEAALTAEVHARIGGNVQRIDFMRTAYAALAYKHLLLPVWLLAFRYGDKSYRVAVNACTGEVNGERPYSAFKIAIAVVLGFVVATALFAIWQGM